MNQSFDQFLRDERGAMSVEWVVLSAAAVSMAIAATDVILNGIDGLSSNLEAQLRTQQISDAFVLFVPTHFDQLYDAGMITEEDAEALFNDANEMTNSEILTALEDYIAKIVNGTISETELEQAYAAASVAYQRNIIDDAVIEYYFTPDGAGYPDPPATSA